MDELANTTPDASPSAILLEVDLPGELVGGVAFDGVGVWVSHPASGGLLRLDPISGAVIGQVQIDQPGTGLTWDGQCLWNVSNEARSIRRIDPESGSIVRTLPLPGEGFFTGLAWDGEALWLALMGERVLMKLDPEDGSVISTLSSDRFVTGVCFRDGELWHGGVDAQPMSAVRASEIRKIHPTTGAVTTRILVDAAVSGVDTDGERFFCGDCTRGALRVVSRTTAS